MLFAEILYSQVFAETVFVATTSCDRPVRAITAGFEQDIVKADVSVLKLVMFVVGSVVREGSFGPVVFVATSGAAILVTDVCGINANCFCIPSILTAHVFALTFFAPLIEPVIPRL